MQTCNNKHCKNNPKALENGKCFRVHIVYTREPEDLSLLEILLYIQTISEFKHMKINNLEEGNRRKDIYYSVFVVLRRPLMDHQG